MTPEEQAPVNCTATRDGLRCWALDGHQGEHYDANRNQFFVVPAPEETVETPDERFLFAVCSICGARIPTRADYVAHQGAHPADSPAPEPAGEAEEHVWEPWMVEGCGEHGPLGHQVDYLDDMGNRRCNCGRNLRRLPSSGTPGLTEARGWTPRTQVTHEGVRSKDGQWWWSWHRGAFREGAWIPDEVAAAIAAEARAPLEARIAEWEQLQQTTVDAAEARIAELERAMKSNFDAWKHAWDRAEDSERKLEEMREALTTANEALRQNITTWLTLAPLLEEPYPDDPRWTPWTRFGKRAADASVNAQAVIRRALTPPAPIAQGDEDAN